jgi:4-hydroxybenzoyl-CoA reductase subunit beta
MLRLPRFRYLIPPSIEEVLAILGQEGPQARVVAGGTDLWPNMKRRHQSAEVVASLMRVQELQGIRNGRGELEIGATTLLSDLAESGLVRARYPMLARAIMSISSPPLRNMATLGGNLLLDTRCTYYNQTEEWRRSIDFCLKEAGTVCWVAPGSSKCWAHSASDAAPALCALEARAILRSAGGERTIPLKDLYRDDGIDYLSKRPEEILTSILIPPSSDEANCRSAFWKLRRRGSIDFAVLSVAVALWTGDGGAVERARVVLGAVSSCPLEVPEAADLLTGKPLDRDSIAAAARMARKVATPMDNADFHTQWRGTMVERYTESALAEAGGITIAGFRPPHPELAI